MSLPLQDQIVKGAIKIIEDPNCWCDGTLARTVWGIPCDPTQWYALRFCAEGAIIRSAARVIKNKGQAESLARKIITECDVAYTNDVVGREAVIQLMRQKYPAV